MADQLVVIGVDDADAAVRQFAKRLRGVMRLLENTRDDYQDYRPLLKRLKVARGKEIASDKPQGAGLSGGGENAGGEKLQAGPPVVHNEDRVLGDTAVEEESILRQIDVQDLISYAHKISYTTFAPPEFARGLGLSGALPPAPQDAQIRASALYRVTDKDVGIIRPPVAAPEQPQAQPPATHALAAPPAPSGKPPATQTVTSGPGVAAVPADTPISETAGTALPAVGVTALAKETPAQGAPLLPLGLAIPPGWKKGDPIPDIHDLPPPPPGWKPGDALPAFPPPAPVPVARPSAPPPTGMLVGHVDLDLNPELDDSDSSDYSDDEDD
eukprot:TRINITY_DN36121_c0_g1_i1.p1 TRINITY_DN36121_c0_g1~~TRINITY_DN36121_c0_g1_i1.p1  ORF type:complete len:327 (+),score=58.00 TRINITY_DN36121_c0_g1_i1:284-1264(+)